MPPRCSVDERFEDYGQLCDTLLSEFWNRGPCVFRNPFGPDMFGSSAEILEALSKRDRRQSLGVYTNQKTGPMPRDDRHWTSPRDTSLRDYVERLVDLHAAETVTLVAGGLQAVDDRIWYRCLRFLTSLYERVGIPFSDAQLYLFAGRYGTTPFGIHKDEDISITCIVEGTKRYLVWPFERLAERLGVSPSARYHSRQFPNFDYAAVRDEAVEFEAHPGDVVYWPWDAWHVVEADGGYCASLQVGSIPFASASAWLVEQTADMAVTTQAMPYVAGAQPNLAARRIADVERALHDPCVLDELRTRHLARRTRFGFKASLEPIAPPHLDPTDAVVAAMPGLIAWTRSSDDLLVSANGYVHRTPSNPGIVAVLRRLNLGKPVGVGTLGRVASEASGASTSVDAVLRDLMAFRALRRLDVACADVVPSPTAGDETLR